MHRYHYPVNKGKNKKTSGDTPQDLKSTVPKTPEEIKTFINLRFTNLNDKKISKQSDEYKTLVELHKYLNETLGSWFHGSDVQKRAQQVKVAWLMIENYAIKKNKKPELGGALSLFVDENFRDDSSTLRSILERLTNRIAATTQTSLPELKAHYIQYKKSRRASVSTASIEEEKSKKDGTSGESQDLHQRTSSDTTAVSSATSANLGNSTDTTVNTVITTSIPVVEQVIDSTPVTSSGVSNPTVPSATPQSPTDISNSISVEEDVKSTAQSSANTPTTSSTVSTSDASPTDTSTNTSARGEVGSSDQDPISVTSLSVPSATPLSPTNTSTNSTSDVEKEEVKSTSPTASSTDASLATPTKDTPTNSTSDVEKEEVKSTPPTASSTDASLATPTKDTPTNSTSTREKVPGTPEKDALQDLKSTESTTVEKIKVIINSRFNNLKEGTTISKDSDEYKTLEQLHTYLNKTLGSWLHRSNMPERANQVRIAWLMIENFANNNRVLGGALSSFINKSLRADDSSTLKGILLGLASQIAVKTNTTLKILRSEYRNQKNVNKRRASLATSKNSVSQEEKTEEAKIGTSNHLAKEVSNLHSSSAPKTLVTDSPTSSTMTSTSAPTVTPGKTASPSETPDPTSSTMTSTLVTQEKDLSLKNLASHNPPGSTMPDPSIGPNSFAYPFTRPNTDRLVLDTPPNTPVPPTSVPRELKIEEPPVSSTGTQPPIADPSVSTVLKPKAVLEKKGNQQQREQQLKEARERLMKWKQNQEKDTGKYKQKLQKREEERSKALSIRISLKNDLYFYATETLGSMRHRSDNDSRSLHCYTAWLFIEDFEKNKLEPKELAYLLFTLAKSIESETRGKNSSLRNILEKYAKKIDPTIKFDLNFNSDQIRDILNERKQLAGNLYGTWALIARHLEIGLTEAKVTPKVREKTFHSLESAHLLLNPATPFAAEKGFLGKLLIRLRALISPHQPVSHTNLEAQAVRYAYQQQPQILRFDDLKIWQGQINNSIIPNSQLAGELKKELVKLNLSCLADEGSDEIAEKKKEMGLCTGLFQKLDEIHRRLIALKTDAKNFPDNVERARTLDLLESDFQGFKKKYSSLDSMKKDIEEGTLENFYRIADYCLDQAGLIKQLDDEEKDLQNLLKKLSKEQKNEQKIGGNQEEDKEQKLKTQRKTSKQAWEINVKTALWPEEKTAEEVYKSRLVEDADMKRDKPIIIRTLRTSDLRTNPSTNSTLNAVLNNEEKDLNRFKNISVFLLNTLKEEILKLIQKENPEKNDKFILECMLKNLRFSLEKIEIHYKQKTSSPQFNRVLKGYRRLCDRLDAQFKSHGDIFEPGHSKNSQSPNEKSETRSEFTALTDPEFAKKFAGFVRTDGGHRALSFISSLKEYDSQLRMDLLKQYDVEKGNLKNEIEKKDGEEEQKKAKLEGKTFSVETKKSDTPSSQPDGGVKEVKKFNADGSPDDVTDDEELEEDDKEEEKETKENLLRPAESKTLHDLLDHSSKELIDSHQRHRDYVLVRNFQDGRSLMRNYNPDKYKDFSTENKELAKRIQLAERTQPKIKLTHLVFTIALESVQKDGLKYLDQISTGSLVFLATHFYESNPISNKPAKRTEDTKQDDTKKENSSSMPPLVQQYVSDIEKHAKTLSNETAAKLVDGMLDFIAQQTQGGISFRDLFGLGKTKEKKEEEATKLLKARANFGNILSQIDIKESGEETSANFDPQVDIIRLLSAHPELKTHLTTKCGIQETDLQALEQARKDLVKAKSNLKLALLPVFSDKKNALLDLSEMLLKLLLTTEKQLPLDEKKLEQPDKIRIQVLRKYIERLKIAGPKIIIDEDIAYLNVMIKAFELSSIFKPKLKGIRAEFFTCKPETINEFELTTEGGIPQIAKLGQAVNLKSKSFRPSSSGLSFFVKWKEDVKDNLTQYKLRAEELYAEFSLSKEQPLFAANEQREEEVFNECLIQFIEQSAKHRNEEAKGLETDMQELLSLFTEFRDIVQTQGKRIDQAEENERSANQHVKEGLADQQSAERAQKLFGDMEKAKKVFVDKFKNMVGTPKQLAKKFVGKMLKQAVKNQAPGIMG